MRQYALPVVGVLLIGLLASAMWFTLHFGTPKETWVLVSPEVHGPDCLHVRSTGVFHVPTLVLENECEVTFELEANRSTFSAWVKSPIAPAVQAQSGSCTYYVDSSATSSCQTSEVSDGTAASCPSNRICDVAYLPPNSKTFLMGMDGPFKLVGTGLEVTGELRSQPYKPWPLSLIS